MKLVQIQKEEENILKRLLQLYLHDISNYFTIDFDESSGLYLYDNLDKYFDNSNNYAYFIKNEQSLLGFMLIDSNDNEMIVQEIFILNQYKNKGIGKNAIYSVFNKHKGNWLIKSLPCSEPSERFWNRTIKEYTNNKYEVEHIGKYNRAVFRFNNLEKC
ncbi:MAG: GNAT family N-acetyltransferase [bacterium]|nr:GNAT family N-acetyltransferase [bacterium]